MDIFFVNMSVQLDSSFDNKIKGGVSLPTHGSSNEPNPRVSLGLSEQLGISSSNNKLVRSLDNQSLEKELIVPGEKGAPVIDREALNEVMDRKADDEVFYKDILVDIFGNFSRTDEGGEERLAEQVRRFMKRFDRGIRSAKTQGLAMAYFINLMIVLFNLRDIRGGKGERSLFYSAFREVSKTIGKTFLEKFIRLLPEEYGSYLDLFKLTDKSSTKNLILKEIVAKISSDAIVKDKEAIDAYVKALQESEKKEEEKSAINDSDLPPPPPSDEKLDVVKVPKPCLSLVAKHIPRSKGLKKSVEESKVQKMRKLIARELAARGILQFDKNYSCFDEMLRTGFSNSEDSKLRKLISEITSHLPLPETKMAEGKFSEIEYNKAAAGAVKKYGKLSWRNRTKTGAVRSELEDRKLGAEIFEESCKKAIKSGGKGIHGANLSIMELVKSYAKNYSGEPDLAVEAQFANMMLELEKKFELPVEGEVKLGNCLAFCDLSGSMRHFCDGVPYYAAVGLSIILMRLNRGAFRNRAMTFASSPFWIDLNEPEEGSESQLYDFVEEMTAGDSGFSTNFEAALDLLLDTAVKESVPASDMPSQIVIFTDMAINQFFFYGDGRQNNPSMDKAASELSTMHGNIMKRYESSGYNPPHVVFWNLRTDGQSHAGAFTPFCSLVSGFSQNLLKMFLSGKILEFKAPTPWDTVTLVLEDERYKKVRDVLEGVTSEELLA